MISKWSQIAMTRAEESKAEAGRRAAEAAGWGALRTKLQVVAAPVSRLAAVVAKAQDKAEREEQVHQAHKAQAERRWQKVGSKVLFEGVRTQEGSASEGGSPSAATQLKRMVAAARAAEAEVEATSRLDDAKVAAAAVSIDASDVIWTDFRYEGAAGERHLMPMPGTEMERIAEQSYVGPDGTRRGSLDHLIPNLSRHVSERKLAEESAKEASLKAEHSRAQPQSLPSPASKRWRALAGAGRFVALNDAKPEPKTPGGTARSAACLIS